MDQAGEIYEATFFVCGCIEVEDEHGLGLCRACESRAWKLNIDIEAFCVLENDSYNWITEFMPVSVN